MKTKNLFFAAFVSVVAPIFLTSCMNEEKDELDQMSYEYTQKKQAQNKQIKVGAYAEYRELTAEELDLFNKTYTGEVELTPESVATQVVSGVNYSFICADSLGNKTKVIIYKPLRGEATVSLIEAVENEGELVGDVDRVGTIWF